VLEARRWLVGCHGVLPPRGLGFLGFLCDGLDELLGFYEFWCEYAFSLMTAVTTLGGPLLPEAFLDGFLHVPLRFFCL